MFMLEGGMEAPMHSHNMFVGLCGMRWRKWSVVREIVVKMLLALCRRTHLSIKHAGCSCVLVGGCGHSKFGCGFSGGFSCNSDKVEGWLSKRAEDFGKAPESRAMSSSGLSCLALT